MDMYVACVLTTQPDKRRAYCATDYGGHEKHFCLDIVATAQCELY